MHVSDVLAHTAQQKLRFRASGVAIHRLYCDCVQNSVSPNLSFCRAFFLCPFPRRSYCRRRRTPKQTPLLLTSEMDQQAVDTSADAILLDTCRHANEGCCRKRAASTVVQQPSKFGQNWNLMQPVKSDRFHKLSVEPHFKRARPRIIRCKIYAWCL